jgi:hypothetical protein
MLKKNKVDIRKVKIIDTESNESSNSEQRRKPNKISDTDYIRPKLTLSDLLTKKDIEGLLLDYERVDSLDLVPIGTHIRYFENKDGELKFRVGGLLKIKGLPDYVILNNGKVGWSVQIKNCIFFRRITLDNVREEYKKIIIDKDIELDNLRSYIKQQKKEILSLKKQLRNKNINT